MNILRTLGLTIAFLVPVAAIASPVVRQSIAPCCPGDCCPDCPRCSDCPDCSECPDCPGTHAH